MSKKKKDAKVSKPRLMKEGVQVETVDSRLSKLSLEELQAKLQDAERNANVYREAIEGRKQEEINKRLEELRSLGWSPSPASRNTLSKPKGEGVKRQRDPNKPCPICNITGHDARAHRSQGKTKKPFTPEELKERNLPAA